MMIVHTHAKRFRLALRIAAYLTPLSVPFLSMAACATSTESSAPATSDAAVIPSADSGADDEPNDGGAEDGPLTLPCAVGNLCFVPTPLKLGYITAMSGRSKSDVWAAGTRGLLLRWNGQAWTSLESNSLESISSIFLTPDEMWAVAGNIVVRRGAEASSVRKLQAKIEVVLAGIAVLPNADAYVGLWRKPMNGFVRPPIAKVGDFDGGQFEMGSWPSIPGVDPDAGREEMTTAALFLVPDKALWVVGEHARVARYPVSPLGTGEYVPVGSQANLFAAWGYDEHLWVAGSHGAILHFDGTDWHAQDSGTTVTLKTIFGLSSRDIWAAGDDGTILHFDGEAWSRVPVGNYHGDLKAIWASASDDVWIGGEQAMFHWGALP
jgi:hypothetical protein